MGRWREKQSFIFSSWNLLMRNSEMHELDDAHRQLQALDWCAGTHRMGAFLNSKTIYWRFQGPGMQTQSSTPHSKSLNATGCIRVREARALNISEATGRDKMRVLITMLRRVMNFIDLHCQKTTGGFQKLMLPY